jgi:ribosomal protein S1
MLSQFATRQFAKFLAMFVEYAVNIDADRARSQVRKLSVSCKQLVGNKVSNEPQPDDGCKHYRFGSAVNPRVQIMHHRGAFELSGDEQVRTKAKV